jgi:hypothetical protein
MELNTYSIMIYRFDIYEFRKLFPYAIFNDIISEGKYAHFYLENCNIVSAHLKCQKIGLILLETTLIL